MEQYNEDFELQNLNLTGNSITTLHSQTFYYNTRLVRLSLSGNSITDIQRSTFQTNSKLGQLDKEINLLQ